MASGLSSIQFVMLAVHTFLSELQISGTGGGYAGEREDAFSVKAQGD